VRSEQRDINIKVLSYCLAHLNLFKLQVGIVPYSDFDDLYSPTEAQIAEHLGESLIRVQRAFAHWKHAGYISITPRPRKNSEGRWESLSPIIVVRKHLLIALGISEAWLTSMQEYVYKKWKAERERRFQKAVAREAEAQRARQKSEHDFFTQELLNRVDGWRDLSRAARGRSPPPNGPPPDIESDT
jgi:DNA-binding transcriptional MocR family regulator